MTAHVDVEELQTTKSEKLLGLVMAAFLLLGGVWIYQKVDDEVRQRVEIAAGSAADREATRRAAFERGRLFRAQRRVAAARSQVTFAREEWRAALDARRPAGALERRYRAAQAELAAARGELARARARFQAVQPSAREAGARLARDQERARDRQELYAFGFRLALVLVSLAVGYWLLAVLRRRNSRWIALGAATLAYATILAFVLAADYLTDYFDPFDYGVALVAAVGVVATSLAFWALQRYLARRLPYRRAKRRECPFCGYPVRENVRCEGCGRQVVGECTTCGERRRVGTLHCGACGAA